MEETKKTNNIVIVILVVIILLLGGFIIYDKFLKTKESVECPKNESTKVDYSSFDVDTKTKLVCTIDMTGLTEVKVKDKCGEDFDIQNNEYLIKVTNLDYNGVKYGFTYELVKDTFAPREDDQGIVKMYVGSTLVAAHDANLRNIFNNIKVENGVLHISEGARSDVPPFESEFDLSKIIK